VNPPHPAADPSPRLAGDLVVWLLVLAELLTFALLFGSFAFARVFQPEVFRTSQATLDLSTGAINTLLLITASWCAARAVRQDQGPRGARWLLGALAAGLGFLVLKGTEYADKIAAGHDLSTNTFYMFYWFLTGFHALHVTVGLIFFALLWHPTRRGRYNAGHSHSLESGAVFWHMVDLLWIVLFPLVYVMR
jgi:nitric oxide reductase NorE protein